MLPCFKIGYAVRFNPIECDQSPLQPIAAGADVAGQNYGIHLNRRRREGLELKVQAAENVKAQGQAASGIPPPLRAKPVRFPAQCELALAETVELPQRS